jgi:PD-(D/E)XK endonuclease
MSRTSSSRRRPSASRSKSVQKNPVQKQTPAQTPRPHELTTKRRGELAELAFTLKAANLGFGVARPYGDSERYDVILDARDLSDKLVERAPPPAAFDLPATKRKNARPKKTSEENAQKNKKNKKKSAEQNGSPILGQHPNRQPFTIAIPPDPSPPLWRVQVKCSTQLSTGLYRINAHRRLNGRAVPYLPGEIHFFAAYIIPEDTWYIIPLRAARGVTSLLFRRRRDRRPGLYDAYREAWHLLRPQP